MDEKIGSGPNDRCRLCKHRHTNKKCFKQHPVLKLKIKRKDKSISPTARIVSEVDNEAGEESDSDSESLNLSKVARASSAIQYKNIFLYDTGAFHHFAHNVKDFITIQKLPKQFRIDQAIGYSVLNQQGTICVKLGNLNLDLSHALYSSNSTCNIISAVRLKKGEQNCSSSREQTVSKN